VGKGPRPTAAVDALGPDEPGASSQVDKPPYRTVRGKGGKEVWECQLKVERRGAVLKAYYSDDGKKWRGPYGHDLPADLTVKFAGELRVGVVVEAISRRENDVTFDQFKLTPVKPKGK
jgi:regulation of enolase protein 1 (concanavalin A-like superfamily)